MEYILLYIDMRKKVGRISSLLVSQCLKKCDSLLIM